MQKASSHPVHSISKPLFNHRGTEAQRGERKEEFLIFFSVPLCLCGLLTPAFGSRVDRAPTHCMQSVAGTISLP
jgi:hypothetical protein